MSTAERSDSVNEIRVLASISGAHVISFYEAFVDASILYIVTELGTHGDLQVPSHIYIVRVCMAWFYHTYHTCNLLSTILMYYVLPLTAILTAGLPDGCAA